MSSKNYTCTAGGSLGPMSGDTPVVTKIDRVLVSLDWELSFPDCLLQALSTNILNHTPLHLSMSGPFCPQRRFCFELFWLKLEGFDQVVQDAWVCDAGLVNPFKRMDALLRNTTMAL